MSELIKENYNRVTIRWKLLTSVSAAALVVATYSSGEAFAAGNDSDRPLVWIELGSQFVRLDDAQDEFVPPFMGSINKPGLLSALNVQSPPTYGLDLDGKISIQPNDSNWVFSVSARYGRSSELRHKHQQTANVGVPVHFHLPSPFSNKYYNFGTQYPNNHVKFADGKAKESENHLILDFLAGKDVGIGLLGSQSLSVLSAGVRFAQLGSKATGNLRAEPDVQYPTAPVTTFSQVFAFKYTPIKFHDYALTADSQRNFHGVGPTVAWNSSMPFAGNPEHGEITIDWGVNAAVLFGRQRTSGHSRTVVETYYKNNVRALVRGPGLHPMHFENRTMASEHPGQVYYPSAPVAHLTNEAAFHRTRSVTVPNVGGFAGLSMRYDNAKVSLGYRADFFFGAIDGGIDTRKSETIGFHGPYASISLGLGG